MRPLLAHEARALLNLRRRGFGGWLATSILSLRSSTPCRRISLRLAIRDQFARTITPPPNVQRVHSKAAGFSKARRPCHSAPNETLPRFSLGRSNRRRKQERKRPVRAGDNTPALRGLCTNWVRGEIFVNHAPSGG